MKPLKLLVFCLTLALAVSCTKTTPYYPTVVTDSFSDTSITYKVQIPTLNNPFMAQNCDLKAVVTDRNGTHTNFYDFTSDCPAIGSKTTLEQTIHTSSTTTGVLISLYNRQTCMSYSTYLRGTSFFGEKYIQLK